MKTLLIDFVNYGMSAPEFYYKMEWCIANVKSVEQLSQCEELINGMSEFFLCCSRLASMALIKRCQLLTTIYAEQE